MSFVKKFKLNYNIKLFNDYLSNKNYISAYKFLLKLKNKNHQDYFLFLSNNFINLIDLPEVFFKRKIVWSISYDLDDLSFINKFFKFYLPKNSKNTFLNKDYSINLSEYYSKYQIDEKTDQIVFNDFVNNSDLFQNLLLFDGDDDFLFLNSCGSFFETNQNRYFINPKLTFCYFYIVPDIENLYLKYKSLYNSTEASFNELFNFNNHFYLHPSLEKNKIKVFENRTNINTNIKSWTDNTVQDTFKGKVITYKKIISEPEEVLLEIIYHLRQYGFDVQINLKDIQDFLLMNPISQNPMQALSNSEKKFINKNLDPEIINYIDKI